MFGRRRSRWCACSWRRGVGLPSFICDTSAVAIWQVELSVRRSSVQHGAAGDSIDKLDGSIRFGCDGKAPTSFLSQGDALEKGEVRFSVLTLTAGRDAEIKPSRQGDRSSAASRDPCHRLSPGQRGTRRFGQSLVLDPCARATTNDWRWISVDNFIAICICLPWNPIVVRLTRSHGDSGNRVFCVCTESVCVSVCAARSKSQAVRSRAPTHSL